MIKLKIFVCAMNWVEKYEIRINVNIPFIPYTPIFSFFKFNILSLTVYPYPNNDKIINGK